MEAEKTDPNLQTMGGCMLAGEIQIRKIKKKAILIVGDTRVGKSTLFNHLLKIPLKGVQIEEGVDVIYEHEFQPGVTTRNTFTSVTLVPNVGQINLNGEIIGLVDLAGFSDQARSYVGIFGVSFMLEKLLESVGEFKFLLAVAHPNFQMSKFEDFIKPFLSFVRILHIEVLLDENHQEIVQRFLNSISIVVIKSGNLEKFYLSKINKMLEHMKKLPNLEKERELVKMILQSIWDNKRVQLFKKAEPEQRPTQNQILERLDTKNWNFYKFEDNLPKQVLFQLPFEKQHAEMKDTDKNLYKNDFEVKSKKMKESYELLKKIFTKTMKNWYSKEPIDYSEQFQLLVQIIQNHPYGSFSLMLKQLQIEFSIEQHEENCVTRLKLLDKFKQIQKACQEINDANQAHESFTKINLMIKPCVDIFNIFRVIVCKNREEQQKFITFMFINKRYLIQSEIQNKMDTNLGSGIPFIIVQNISNILPTSCENLDAQFLVGFNYTEQEREKYVEVLFSLDINGIADSELAKQLLLIKINISVKAGKKFIKRGQFKEGLQKLVVAHKDFENFKQLLPEEAEISVEDKNLAQYKSLQIYDLIGTCLQNLNLHRQAVKIYTYTKSIYLLMKCYERKIEKQKTRKKKFELYEDYLDILQKNRKSQKVIQVLEKMIDIFRCFPEKRRELIQNLKNKKQNKQINQQGVEQVQHIDLSELIEQIEQDLAYHVDEIQEDEEASQDEDEVFKCRNQNLNQDEENKSKAGSYCD